MLDFKWKNGQAPSLNASNMQLITDAINSNEAKIKDVESEVAEIVIEHGGSIVVPNPEEEPTEMLNTVKINNDVFELGASGDTGIEVTQAEYDALEEAGEIEADVNYFITDGERSNLLIDDSKTGLNNAWSAHKVNGELDDLKASLNEFAKPSQVDLKFYITSGYIESGKVYFSLPIPFGCKSFSINSLSIVLYYGSTSVNLGTIASSNIAIYEKRIAVTHASIPSAKSSATLQIGTIYSCEY